MRVLLCLSYGDNELSMFPQKYNFFSNVLMIEFHELTQNFVGEIMSTKYCISRNVISGLIIPHQFICILLQSVYYRYMKQLILKYNLI